MKISIIVPVYNCADYLCECIDSLLYERDLLDIEVLLIDDGSSDSSGYICDRYAEMYNQIKVIHKTNGGVSRARNVGIEYATGEWIMFVDGDDKIEYNTFSVLLKKLETNQYDMIRFPAYRLASDSNIVNYKLDYSEKLDNYRDLILQRRTALGVCGGIYKRTLFTNYSIRFTPDIRYGEDWLVLYKLACHAKNYGFEPTRLYAYRINENSVTEQKINYVRTDALKAFNLILAYAKKNNINLNPRSIGHAKCMLRCDVIKNTLLSGSKAMYVDTDKALAKYVDQSFWEDIRYSRKVKYAMGLIVYRIMLLWYGV